MAGQRWLRLGVPALALVLGAGSARASVLDFFTEALMSQQMPRLPDDGTQEKPRAVMLNGFPMYVVTGRSDRPIKDVLDYYQSKYQGGALKQVAGKPIAVRREGPTTGTLLAVEVADKQTAMDMMQGKRTIVTGGPLRMVYAKRSGLTTDYMTVWSDKPMPQSLLQPVQSGDAPGEEIAGAPRPMGSERSFSFSEPKAGYLLVTYRVNGSPAGALSAALMVLNGAGWQEDGAFAKSAQGKGQHVARLQRGVRDLVVTARVGKGGGTQVTYLGREGK